MLPFHETVEAPDGQIRVGVRRIGFESGQGGLHFEELGAARFDPLTERGNLFHEFDVAGPAGRGKAFRNVKLVPLDGQAHDRGGRLGDLAVLGSKRRGARRLFNRRGPDRQAVELELGVDLAALKSSLNTSRISALFAFIHWRQEGDVIAMLPLLKATERWHHVSAVLDADDSSISIYLDGKHAERRGRNAGTHLRTFDDTPWRIGIGNLGDIDEVRIYNRTLSDYEISALFNLGEK